MSGEKYFSQIQMMVAPTRATHVVNLKYLINYVSGKIKNPVRAVITTNLDSCYHPRHMILTSLYAELLPDPDGVPLELGDRILLVGQDNKAHNGVYVFMEQSDTVCRPWVLQRAPDFRTPDQVTPQIKIPVSEGTIYGDTLWVLLTEDTPIVIGKTELEFMKVDDVLERVIPSKAVTFVGDGTSREFEIRHGFDTLNITHSIYNEIGETVYMDVTRTDRNTLKIDTGIPPEEGETYTIALLAVSENK